MPSSWSNRLAKGVAYVFSPLLFPPLLPGLVPAHYGASAAETGWVLAIIFVFFVFLPLGCAVSMVRRRKAASIEVPNRRPRTRLFGLGVASYLAGLVLVASTAETAVTLVAAIMACYALILFVVLVVNLRWKISAHAAAAGGFASMLLFLDHANWASSGSASGLAALLSPAALLLCIGIVPLVMWARVRTGAHTLRQVIAGAAFGLTAPYALLYVLDVFGAFQGL